MNITADRVPIVEAVPGVADAHGGVFVDGAVASVLPVEAAEAGIADGAFEGGIVPKLMAAVHAARGGVRASIGATEVPV